MKKRKKMKPVIAWAALHPDGDMSSLIHDDQDMKRVLCENRSWRFRAYVRDTATGKNVMACDHKHRSRFKTWRGKNGEYYAMQCARKMLRQLLASSR